LWARQIARESDTAQEIHRAMLNARARLIWNNTTPITRRGHFAMGVGLEAGLQLDELANKLARLLDKADVAAIMGNEDDLADALVKLGQHVLSIRPFVPDSKNALPEDWDEILTSWIKGVNVNDIGTENMGVVEDAFCYRLVWALEAVRMRRITHGWSPDIVPGGAAACLETGVPQFMIAMLIRAGLPSRQAAMLAVHDGQAQFVDGAGMREWLQSKEIAEKTKTNSWPSPETAELWKRFRNDVLTEANQKWRRQESKRVLEDTDKRPPDGIYRIEVDHPAGDAWISTPDYQRMARLKTRVIDRKPSFFTARLIEGHNRAQVLRFGKERATWLDNTDQRAT
jgi:hypothetical protein